MSGNYFDYLSWRGDLSFDVDPLNEIDITAFALLVYIDYNDIIGEHEELTFAQALERFIVLGKKIEPLGLIISSDYTRIFSRWAHSTRFASVKMKGYVGDVDDDQIGQFSGIVFETDKERIICFSGTDDTITGWKESINLVVEEIVPAQKKAKEYLAEYAKGDKINYVVGHSKGGNLAMYAYMHADEEVRKNIRHVYSMDGPGLMYEEWNKDDCKKITEIVSQDSIIGRLFRHFGKIKVVHSTAKGIYQHDPFTWQIVGKHFVSAKQSQQSKEIQEAFDEILLSMTIEERKEFIRLFHEILRASRIYTLTDIDKGGISKIMKSYYSLKSPERKVVHDVLKKFMSVKAIRTALWDGMKEYKKAPKK